MSHVPHLTAATLMGLAATRSEEHGALLRLAAGGFRDMTRIAAGDPGIWLDICTDNRAAILDVLDDLLSSLAIHARGGRDAATPTRCCTGWSMHRQARRNLPTGAPPAEQLAEVRVSIPDQPGELAAVTALATETVGERLRHRGGPHRRRTSGTADRRGRRGERTDFAAALTETRPPRVRPRAGRDDDR